MPSPISAALLEDIAPTGRLRASLNLGNPVLARSRTATEQPAGVTIDLARAFGQTLGLEVELKPFNTPGEAGAAVIAGETDICFLAIDPTRAEALFFTSPYVRIEGCYLVRDSSPLQQAAEVDRPGRRIVVGVASAYALFLQRHLQSASLVEVGKSEAVVDAFLADPSLDVAAGVRQQLQTDAARVGGVRLLPEAFMEIRQAMAMSRSRSPEAQALLESFMVQARASGFIAAALERHGIEGAEALA